MDAIRFPGSYGIGNNSGRTEMGRHDIKRSGFSGTRGGSDVIEISPEAKDRFERENLVRLDRIRLKKETESYRRKLADYIDFKEADLRNIYRLDKIREARRKLYEGLYDNPSDEILKKLVEKPDL
ncbi:MAG TPA: hypothetical protein PK358_13345 [Spirochaetota bacterium]|nr:hypothetical protein [Spirochaetota bacterium]HPJ35816.1 hypothetical protein [Spirochaetota bacterium]